MARQTEDADPSLKVVVRRLPAQIPESVFWSSVDQTGVSDWDWRTFDQGKESKSRAKDTRSSTAYIRFKNVDAVVAFAKLYNGHLFKDSKGNISEAQVEFAPYQKAALPPKKPDPKQGTVENDPEYIDFLRILNTKEDSAKDPNPVSSATANASADGKKTNEVIITPLIEHLKAKRDKQAADKEAASSTSKSAANTTKGKEKETTPKPSAEKGKTANVKPTPPNATSSSKTTSNSNAKPSVGKTSGKSQNNAPSAPQVGPSTEIGKQGPTKDKKIPTAPKAATQKATPKPTKSKESAKAGPPEKPTIKASAPSGNQSHQSAAAPPAPAAANKSSQPEAIPYQPDKEPSAGSIANNAGDQRIDKATGSPAKDATDRDGTSNAGSNNKYVPRKRVNTTNRLFGQALKGRGGGSAGNRAASAAQPKEG